MYYGTIKPCDIANGTGVRVSLFVSGCRHCCEDCFNPETWDFTYGTVYTKETEKEILQLLSPDYIQGLTLLGGEPMEIENQPTLLSLVQAVREMYGDRKDIWCYTGCVLESDLLQEGSSYRCDATDAFLHQIDVLVDGPFIKAQKTLTRPFCGSENQRILRLKEIFTQK